MSAARGALTVGLVLIGDELLSAQVEDSNGAWMLGRLRALGARAREVSVVPDDRALIAEALRRQCGRWDVVLTSGGVGPTCDDVTMEAAALAFDAPLAEDPTLRAWLERRFADEDPRSRATWLRVARLPAGAKLRWDGDQWPVCQVQNAWIMPGSPHHLRRQFEAISEALRGTPRAQQTILLTAGEGLLAPLLEEVARRFPGVTPGSYPAVAQEPWRVKVTLEGEDAARVAEAAAAFEGWTAAWRWTG
jgi:molybdenum cofactor synthesis domain-containing protein